MTIIEKKQIPCVDARGFVYKKRTKTILILQCDTCFSTFENKYTDITLYENRPYHFCSIKCKSASQAVAEKTKSTNLKKYGGPAPASNPDVMNKITQTNLEKFGTHSVMKLPSFREALHKHCQDNYGVNNPAQSQSIKEKIVKTSLERYGVTSFTKTSEYNDKRKLTSLAKYGVEHHMMLSEFVEKRHNTAKSNGLYGSRKSKIEDKFFISLCKEFGANDIERFVIINSWNVDFLIKSSDTYIQFDGVYWHGLDRPITEIEKCYKQQDQYILKTYKRDRLQDEWFASNNLKLVRVTDKMFKRLDFQEILKLIK